MKAIHAAFSPEAGKRQTVTNLYIFCMLLFFPLFTGLRGYAAITASKYYFFAVLTLLWLFSLAGIEIAGRVRPARLELSGIFALALLFVLFLSGALSPMREYVFWGAGRYDGLCSSALYILVFLGVSRYGALGQEHIFALGTSVCVCGVVSLLQLLGLDPLWLFPGDLTYYDAGVRYSGVFLGTLGNVDILAAYLSLALPVLLGAFTVSDDRSLRLSLIPIFWSAFMLAAAGTAGGLLACLAAAALMFPVLAVSVRRLSRLLLALGVCCLAAFFAFSVRRAGFAPDVKALCALALAAAMLIFSLLSRRLPQLGIRSLRRAFIISLAVLMVLLLVFLWFYPGGGTLGELSAVLHGHIDDSFGSSRVLIWRSILPLVREHPVLGGGPGTLAARLDVTFSRFIEETGETMTTQVDNAHNVYLACLADVGILGLALLLALIISAFFCRGGGSGASVLRLCVFSGCIEALFGLGLCLSAPLLWIFMGLCAQKDKSELLSRRFQWTRKRG